jgi:hypothetical protein
MEKVIRIVDLFNTTKQRVIHYCVYTDALVEQLDHLQETVNAVNGYDQQLYDVVPLSEELPPLYYCGCYDGETMLLTIVTQKQDDYTYVSQLFTNVVIYRPVTMTVETIKEELETLYAAVQKTDV